MFPRQDIRQRVGLPGELRKQWCNKQ